MVSEMYKNRQDHTFENKVEVLADVDTSARLNDIHLTKISAQWGAQQSYKNNLSQQ